MKQSIIAILITAIMAVCGGSLGSAGNHNSSNQGNVVTTEVDSNTFVEETEQSTYESETDQGTTTQSQTEVLTQEAISEETVTTSCKQEITVPAVTDTQTTERQTETYTATTEHPSEAQTTTSASDSSQSMSYAEQVIELVNEERTNAGLNKLSADDKISEAAMVRAKEIGQMFSHTRPNGKSFSTVLSESGISFRGAGENIAWGQKSAQEVMNGWMNSSGHRANILNASYTKIGVAYYVGTNGRTYWVQLFTY